MTRYYNRRLAAERRFCSFCEKERGQVLSMIIGTFGHICNECVVKFYRELPSPAAEQSHEEKK